ncbi:hypothetical protein [Wenxinia marina]|uniref:Uncharacterized protein n=1 Tax=Wenxinia marina DSM 24838 TaxID=1123501 RepID=A0A0D0QC80_9RHOB|nr:hypothetical protein [Wenxinia marina]KIQ69922.1 hypothetical protein Wenmar_01492 [Wenxinia marina DSM 24838]GGL62206.1 hypothetical protein GCM10011392_15950 [Wenxinia marina]
MAEAPPIEKRGEDYVLRLSGLEGAGYRVTVPGPMLDEELGASATEGERRAWIEAHLAGILGVVTARETGGVVDAPWGGLLVEEVP